MEIKRGQREQTERRESNMQIWCHESLHLLKDFDPPTERVGREGTPMLCFWFLLLLATPWCPCSNFSRHLNESYGPPG